MVNKFRLTEFFRVMGLMKNRVWIYIIWLLISCGSLAGYELINSQINKNLINAAVNKQFDLLIKTMILGLIAFILTNIILDPIARYIIRNGIQKTIFDIRLMLVNHVIKLPAVYLDSVHSGEIMSKINNDLAKLEAVYGDNLHQVVTTMLQGIGAMVMMIILDWRLAMMTILIGLFASMINLQFSRPIRKVSDIIQNHLGVVTQYLIDIFSGFHVIKMFNISGVVMQKFTAENDLIVDHSIKYTVMNAQIDSINFVIALLNLVGVICLAVFMMYNGSVEIGTVIAVMTLQNSSNSLFLRLGGFLARLQNSLAGAARIFDLMDEDEESSCSDLGEVGYSDQMVAFQNVSFAYQDGKEILEEINFSVQAGEKVALVGCSGGGKSTIFKLLLGLYRPTQGEIIIAGSSQNAYTLGQLRGELAYVSQDTHLFNTTIAENIRYGKLVTTEEEIVRVAKAAYAHDFIMAMPEGYSTVVGEGGVRLSGGERQRIAIARALLKDAPILLLDEATSGLDSGSEQLVQRALETLTIDRTVITIAHRISTIEEADKIIVLDQRRVSEMGTHLELLKQKGIYYSLVGSTENSLK